MAGHHLMVRRLAFQNPSDPKNRVAMNRAKFTARGQITVPAEERRRLHHVPGDKVLFVEKPSGEVVAAKARLAALAQARDAFAGAATDVGVSDEDDVQALVDDMRDRGVWPESSLTPMSSAGAAPPGHCWRHHRASPGSAGSAYGLPRSPPPPRLSRHGCSSAPTSNHRVDASVAGKRHRNGRVLIVGRARRSGVNAFHWQALPCRSQLAHDRAGQAPASENSG